MASPAGPSASSSPHAGQPPAPGVLHLEHFLDAVLKQSLERVQTQRDATRTAASQCTQLMALLDDMQAMSRSHSFIAAASEMDRAGQLRQQQQHLSSSKTAEAEEEATSSASASVASASRRGVTARPRANKILVDLGHHFYTQAYVANAEVVHVNLGCGVVLPMAIDEAKVFLVSKERVLRERAGVLTREVLRIKYRIRLVTEAIARLHDRELGKR